MIDVFVDELMWLTSRLEPIEAKIASMRSRLIERRQQEAKLPNEPDQQISTTNPDARSMACWISFARQATEIELGRKLRQPSQNINRRHPMTVVVQKSVLAVTRMQEVFEHQAATALRLRSSTADERIAKIRKLRDAVIAHADEWYRAAYADFKNCLLYTSPSPRDRQKSRMPSSA